MLPDVQQYLERRMAAEANLSKGHRLSVFSQMSLKNIYLSIFIYKFTLYITVLGLHSHLIATSTPHRGDSLYPHIVQVMVSI